MTVQTLPSGRITRNAVSSSGTVDWRLRSACRDVEDPELFFSTTAADREEAKRICARCPVQIQCLNLAVEFRAPAGVWAGVERSDGARSYGASHLPAVEDILLNRRSEVDAAVANGMTPAAMAEMFHTNLQTINNLMTALGNGEVDWQLDEPDADIVRAYLAGEVRDVHPRNQLAAVVQGVREGLTYAHFDRLHGLRAHTTGEFIRKTRKMFAVAGVEFPDMGRKTVHRMLEHPEVREMRELSATMGVSDRDLAFQFDVSPKTVRSILSGKSYKGAGGPLRAPLSTPKTVECLTGDAGPVVGQQDMRAAA